MLNLAKLAGRQSDRKEEYIRTILIMKAIGLQVITGRRIVTLTEKR